MDGCLSTISGPLLMKKAQIVLANMTLVVKGNLTTGTDHFIVVHSRDCSIVPCWPLFMYMGQLCEKHWFSCLFWVCCLPFVQSFWIWTQRPSRLFQVFIFETQHYKLPMWTTGSLLSALLMMPLTGTDTSFAGGVYRRSYVQARFDVCQRISIRGRSLAKEWTFNSDRLLDHVGRVWK